MPLVVPLQYEKVNETSVSRFHFRNQYLFVYGSVDELDLFDLGDLFCNAKTNQIKQKHVNRKLRSASRRIVVPLFARRARAHASRKMFVPPQHENVNATRVSRFRVRNQYVSV